MKQHVFPIVVAAVAVAVVVAATSAHAQQCDTSTEEGANAFFKKAAGRDIHTQCMSMPSTRFKGLYVVQDFAYDAGCIVSAIIYRCTLDDKDAQKRALSDAGWAKADEKTKTELAFAWIAETSRDEGTLKDEDKAIAAHKKKWEAPNGKLKPDGSLVIRYWVKSSGGMRPGTTYSLIQRVFGADGAPGETKSVEHIDVKN